MNKEIKLERVEVYPSYSQGQIIFSSDIFQCTCGQWRRFDEKCIHIIKDGRIIDYRSENLI
jgi:hypothetical protein